MSDYLRPTLPPVTYRDEQGRPIRYGSRWSGGSPPEGAYSRTSNLERFAPVHTVATELIEWLQKTFDVAVEADPSTAVDLLLEPKEIVRAVRLTPGNAQSAPLTFVFTPFPGVYIHAGALHDFHFPVCGCDACDDDVETLLDELEWTVRTVVGGGYSERIDSSPEGWIEYRLDEPDVGMHGGRSRARDLPAGHLDDTRRPIPEGGRWAAWSPRRSPDDENWKIGWGTWTRTKNN